MRRIDTAYATWLAGTPSSLATRESYCAKYVASEYERVVALAIDDEMLASMREKHMVYQRLDRYSSNEDRTAEALTSLVASINVAADEWDRTLVAIAPANNAADETKRRHERKRRAGIKQIVGTTQARTLRGVLGTVEGTRLLTTLQAALTGALGHGYPLGLVGVRGSSITGIRSRYNTPFEDALGPYQNVSDASDLDFFFTCHALEGDIRATQNNLHANRRINQSGTMSAQYLRDWFNLGAGTNRYAHSAALLLALTAFQDNAEVQIGRKCDVTFVGTPLRNNLVGEVRTLIL